MTWDGTRCTASGSISEPGFYDGFTNETECLGRSRHRLREPHTWDDLRAFVDDLSIEETEEPPAWIAIVGGAEAEASTSATGSAEVSGGLVGPVCYDETSFTDGGFEVGEPFGTTP